MLPWMVPLLISIGGVVVKSALQNEVVGSE